MDTTEKLEQTIESDGDGEPRPRRRRTVLIGTEVLAVAGGIVAAQRLKARTAQRRRRRIERLYVRFR